MTFKDHFSGHAESYATFRPGYSPQVFDFVASLPRRRQIAWDCATGNGQAAVGLAARFARVIATDASERPAPGRPSTAISRRRDAIRARGSGGSWKTPGEIRARRGPSAGRS